MKRDLVLDIDDIILNIRVGVIFKYNDKVLIEIRKDRTGNSVIPGGRIRIGERSIDALKREIMEEMDILLVDDKIIYKKTMENFFTFDEKKCHEIFFIYEYIVDDEDYQTLLKVKENQDSNITEYIFINYDQFDEVDLLPLEIRNIIKE